MNHPIAENPDTGWKQRLRQYRRKQIKTLGRFLIHALSRLIAQQSLIGDKPVFDRSVFPWVAELETHWPQDPRRTGGDSDNPRPTAFVPRAVAGSKAYFQRR